MTLHGVNAGSFYGFAPMHAHPHADKVCTVGDYLRCFYVAQGFLRHNPLTSCIIKVRATTRRQ